MKYNIILLPDAEEEVMQSALFYKQISTELSSDILNKFFEALTIISENPLLYQAVKKEYRIINLKRFPFKIVFRIKQDEIFIVAFSHNKLRPYYWRNR